MRIVQQHGARACAVAWDVRTGVPSDEDGTLRCAVAWDVSTGVPSDEDGTLRRRSGVRDPGSAVCKYSCATVACAAASIFKPTRPLTVSLTRPLTVSRSRGTIEELSPSEVDGGGAVATVGATALSRLIDHGHIGDRIFLSAPVHGQGRWAVDQGKAELTKLGA